MEHTHLNIEEQKREREKLREAVLKPLRTSTIWSKIWIAFLFVIIGIGLFAYYKQLTNGLKVTSLRDYASWGVYISNFVFFVAISLCGSLISSILIFKSILISKVFCLKLLI